jgi:hypothetical protein
MAVALARTLFNEYEYTSGWVHGHVSNGQSSLKSFSGFCIGRGSEVAEVISSLNQERNPSVELYCYAMLTFVNSALGWENVQGAYRSYAKTVELFKTPSIRYGIPRICGAEDLLNFSGTRDFKILPKHLSMVVADNMYSIHITTTFIADLERYIIENITDTGVLNIVMRAINNEGQVMTYSDYLRLKQEEAEEQQPEVENNSIQVTDKCLYIFDKKVPISYIKNAESQKPNSGIEYFKPSLNIKVNEINEYFTEVLFTDVRRRFRAELLRRSRGTSVAIPRESESATL